MSKFLQSMNDPAYRAAFVEAQIDLALPTQIKALRAQRNWSQAELADRAGMKQARISAIENAKEGSLNLKTLRRLAEAFDVALVVRFAPFSELTEWASTYSPDAFAVPSFNDERRIERAKPARPGTMAPLVLLDLLEPPTKGNWLLHVSLPKSHGGSRVPATQVDLISQIAEGTHQVAQTSFMQIGLEEQSWHQIKQP